jgi:predicted DNA-binding transcriptional regulator YafY
VASILSVKDTGETFRRPPRFDLQRHWETSLQRFEAGLYRGTAVVRASPAGLERLREISDAVRKAVDRSKGKPDRKGWRRVTIPIESVGWSAIELTKAGAECEVVSPPELRTRMGEIAAGMAKLYGLR